MIKFGRGENTLQYFRWGEIEYPSTEFDHQKPFCPVMAGVGMSICSVRNIDGVGGNAKPGSRGVENTGSGVC